MSDFIDPIDMPDYMDWIVPGYKDFVEWEKPEVPMPDNWVDIEAELE